MRPAPDRSWLPAVVLSWTRKISLNFKATGKLVWLKASPATIKARLSQDRNKRQTARDLTASGTLDEVEEVLTAREPLYQAAAAVSLAVDTLPAAAVAQRLVDLVRLWEQEQQ